MGALARLIFERLKGQKAASGGLIVLRVEWPLGQGGRWTPRPVLFRVPDTHSTSLLPPPPLQPPRVYPALHFSPWGRIPFIT